MAVEVEVAAEMDSAAVAAEIQAAGEAAEAVVGLPDRDSGGL